MVLISETTPTKNTYEETSTLQTMASSTSQRKQSGKETFADFSTVGNSLLLQKRQLLEHLSSSLVAGSSTRRWVECASSIHNSLSDTSTACDRTPSDSRCPPFQASVKRTQSLESEKSDTFRLPNIHVPRDAGFKETLARFGI